MTPALEHPGGHIGGIEHIHRGEHEGTQRPPRHTFGQRRAACGSMTHPLRRLHGQTWAEFGDRVIVMGEKHVAG